MKSVLVTGGAGFLGSVLCEELLKKNYHVVCLDRFFFGRGPVEALMENSNFEVIKSDIRFANEEQLKGIDAVIDLAGISNDPSCDIDPKFSEDVNCEGCLRLAELAKAAGIRRYIYSSSCSVYGHGSAKELTEESPMSPVSLYARTKVTAENKLTELASDDFCVTMLRNATLYGLSPRMRFDLLCNEMTLCAVTRRKIFVLGGGKQWRPNVHVRDAARAFVLALEAPEKKVQRQVFNVGSNEQNYQVIQVANMICDVVPYTEYEVVPDDADKRNYNVNFDKITRELGFRPNYSLVEGAVEIKQAIEKSIVEVDDLRTNTVKYYKYLIEADKVLDEVKLNGCVF